MVSILTWYQKPRVYLFLTKEALYDLSIGILISNSKTLEVFMYDSVIVFCPW